MEQDGQEPLDELKSFLEQKAKEKSATPEPPPPKRDPFFKRHPRLLLWLQLCFVLASAAYVYSAIPEIRAAAEAPKQYRLGPYDTDAAADACIANLWRLGGGMAQPQELTCPASGRPYAAEPGRFVCPAPASHGLTALYFQQYQGVTARRNE